MIKIDKNIHKDGDFIETASMVFCTDKSRIFYILAPNGDLFFTIYFNRKTSMYIDKFDDYKLYMAVDKLYNSIEDVNGEIKTKKISIKSDFSNDEFIYNKENTYNYLDIYKSLDAYMIKFVNNSKNHYEFCINRNNRKYAQIFQEFLNDLILMDDQITLDEYVYKEKILEKRKKLC